ncbi:phosphorylase [Leptospira levettii]|uniref:phosphorylase n=1 Tax=Leptospira levettii TaxID=2023178 RepID=UPI003EC0A959
MPSLFFAVLSEAKPWIQKTNAKPVHHSGKFRIYKKDSMYIIISGIGKMAMALAVSEFAHLLPKEERDHMKVWNLGIVGSNQLNWKVGDFFWIHKVTDYSTGKDYYPERMTKSVFGMETNLTTFDRPIAKIKTDNQFQVLNEKDLESVSLVDMEGVGFFEAASLYFPLENISIGKVISDHLEGNFCKPETVESILANLLEPLFLEWTNPLPWVTEDPFETRIWPEIWKEVKVLRLTETMKHDLKKSLRFYFLRYPNTKIPMPNLEIVPKIKSKTEVKSFVEEWKKQLHV